MPDKFGIPRQPNLVAIKSHIRFITPYNTPDAFVGIEHYSHLWILWQFHHNKAQAHFRPQVRPPRFGGNDKTGVFATRSMYRPSQIGLSVVQLDKVQIFDNQVILHIIGADMVDGTPILDIKPYIAFDDSIPTAQSVEKPNTKSVVFDKIAQANFEKLIENQILNDNDQTIITTLIAQDPRPAYRQQETHTPFVMRYKTVDVGFFDDGQRLVVDAVKCVL